MAAYRCAVQLNVRFRVKPTSATADLPTYILRSPQVRFGHIPAICTLWNPRTDLASLRIHRTTPSPTRRPRN